jgi:hypothetical protein
MSITSNALLVMAPRSSRGRATRLVEQGALRVDPRLTGEGFRERRGTGLLERRNLELRDYLNADSRLCGCCL